MPYKDPNKERENAKMRSRRWRIRHPERAKQSLREYRLRNKKLCIERTKRWRHKNPEKVRIWRLNNRKKLNEITRAWRASHPGYVTKKTIQYRLKYTDRELARSRLQSAIKWGKIIRPSTCQRCGKPCKPHGHHHNGYEREHILDVIWLCSSCHNKVHKSIMGSGS